MVLHMSVLVAIGIVGAGIACVFLAGKSPKEKEHYVLRTLKAPKINMRLLVTLLDLPIFGALLCKALYRSNLFHTLREVSTVAHPTFAPVVPPQTLVEEKDVLSCEEFLEEVLDLNTPENSPFVSVCDYAMAYRKGKTTPLIVAHNVIQAIEKSSSGDAPLNAFINVHTSDILEQARVSSARYESGKPLSALDGVPIGVKDEFDVAGYPTTVGTIYLKTVAQSDATLVRRLRELGAIIIGKCNMHEIGLSTVGFNPHHGTPRNPYDPSRHCGGSSSGSAAAVGAGLCPLSVGADGGGSIRVPAGLCGVVGLKATFGRISEHGAFPLCWTVAHGGPIAGCVQDCAIGYAAMCGVDPKDCNTTLQPPAKIPRFSAICGEKPLEGIRIGIYEPWSTHANANMLKAYNTALDIMCSLGAVKKNVEILGNLLENSRIAHSLVITSEMATSMSQHYCNDKAAMGLDCRATLATIRQGSNIDYIQANRIRTLAIEGIQAVFEEVDVILTPNTAVEAPKIPTQLEMDIELVSLLMRFAFLGNFTGIPGIALPITYADNQGGCSVPLSIQIMGAWWQEHTLLKIAYALESKLHKRTPKIHYKLL